LGLALEDVELVELSFAVAVLLGREEEGLLLPVGQDGHRYAPVEGVLEELAVRTFALSDLLDLDQYCWLARGVTQCVISSSCAQGVLWGDDLCVVDGSPQGVEQALDYALGDGRLVYVAPAFDACANV